MEVTMRFCLLARYTSFFVPIGLVFFFSSRRRHTRLQGDWSSDVCSSDLETGGGPGRGSHRVLRVGHGRHRLGPPAPALLPRWLRRSRRRRPMIGTELLDDPRADPVLVRRQLRDIARLNALFGGTRDRKSTRLNSSHLVISYAVFCLKKKKKPRRC